MQHESQGIENHELAGLAGLADEVDGGAAAVAAPGDPHAPQPIPAGPDYGQEAAGMVDMFGAMVCGYAPAAEPLWSPETKGRMAASIAPVMEKYGVSFGALPVEVTALIVCGPVLYQSARVVAAQINADKAKAAAAQSQAVAHNAAPAAAPAAPADTPEQPRHAQMALYQK